RPYLTVETDGPVNINTASSRVLEALGLPDSLIQKILWIRNDGASFGDVGSILSLLKANSIVSADEEKALTSAIQQGLIGVRSNALHLEITARLPDSPGVQRVDVVAAGLADQMRILEWEETAR